MISFILGLLIGVIIGNDRMRRETIQYLIAALKKAAGENKNGNENRRTEN